MTGSELKTYRDLKNSLDTAFQIGYEIGYEIGFQKGILQTKLEMIHRMFELNFPFELIQKITGLNQEEIEQLRI